MGIALDRFRPIPRAEARERLGLDPAGPYLLFPHDPVPAAEALRPRARGGGRRAAPARWAASRPRRSRTGSTRRTPCWSRPQDEGFGLAVIEALACGVPAFATPVGIHPVALHGIDGACCEEWDARALARRARAAARGARPAGRRPRARRAVLRRPDGRSRGRGLARHPPGTGRGAGEPLESGLYSAVRAHRRPRSGTDHERTPATHEALAPRRRRRAPCGGHGRRAGEWRGTPGRSRRGDRRRDARRARRGRRPARLADAEPSPTQAAAETPAGETPEPEPKQPEAPKPVLVREPGHAGRARAGGPDHAAPARRPSRPPAAPAALPAPRPRADAARPRRACSTRCTAAAAGTSTRTRRC